APAIANGPFDVFGGTAAPASTAFLLPPMLNATLPPICVRMSFDGSGMLPAATTFWLPSRLVALFSRPNDRTTLFEPPTLNALFRPPTAETVLSLLALTAMLPKPAWFPGPPANALPEPSTVLLAMFTATLPMSAALLPAAAAAFLPTAREALRLPLVVATAFSPNAPAKLNAPVDVAKAFLPTATAPVKSP